MPKKNFVNSLRDAFRGLILFFTSELHALYHSIAAVIVIAFGFIFGVNLTEWAVLTIAIGLVFTSEFANTVIERMMNMIHPDRHQEVGRIKDMAAGMVLFCSLIAVVLGILVFSPYILEFI